LASSPAIRPAAALRGRGGGGGAAAGAGVADAFPPSASCADEQEQARDAFPFSSEALAEVPFHREYRGGMRAAIIEGPGIYYLGIIDICQRYTWSKWAERMVKIYFGCRNRHGLSAMPPEAYAARFNTRVVGQLLDYDVPTTAGDRG
jgi:1-phosphatidylinositol-4-phosphate 5-kinase